MMHPNRPELRWSTPARIRYRPSREILDTAPPGTSIDLINADGKSRWGYFLKHPDGTWKREYPQPDNVDIEAEWPNTCVLEIYFFNAAKQYTTEDFGKFMLWRTEMRLKHQLPLWG